MKSPPTGIRRSIAQRGAFMHLLALALTLGACSNARHDARTELFRLDEAMQRHAAQYGSFPETLDARRSSSRTNLPHRPARKVDVRLLGVAPDGYQASARRGSWLCWTSVGPRQKAQPSCYPRRESSRDLPDAPGEQPPLLDGVLTRPGAPSKESDPPSPPRPGEGELRGTQ